MQAQCSTVSQSEPRCEKGQLELSDMGPCDSVSSLGVPVGTFPQRIPQPCSSCGAPSIGVSRLDFSELFLQPRAQLSTSICVPHPRWHQGCARRSSRGSSHQITTQESEVSIFPETSQQPGASYKSP